MAEIPDSMNWMNFWGDLQKQSMDNWQSMMRKSAPTPSSVMDNPMQFWQDSVSQWWRAIERGPAPAPEQAFWKSTSSANEWFFRLGEEMFKVLQGMQEGGRMGREWTDTLNRMVQQAKDVVTKNMFTDPNAFYGLFGMPMDTMQRMMATASFMPGDIFKSFRSMRPQMPGMIDPNLKANLQQFLSTPAIGYTREWQEQGQEAAKQMVEYQEAAQEYMGLIAKALTQALDLIHKRLLERGASDKPVHSLKELYSLMVDCGEEAFGELAMSQDYPRANSRLINAMMQIKNQSKMVMEEMMTAMSMPSRTELDTAHLNIMELKRRVRALEDEIRTLKKKDVEPEVAALKENVEQLPIKEFRSELEKLKKQMQESLTDKGEGEGEGEGELGDGDDKADPARAAIRRPRTTRAKPQSEGA